MEYIHGIDEEEIKSRTVFNTKGNLVFDPLLYEQRYMIVIRILLKFRKLIKKVCEFGCNDMKFFPHIKNGLKHVQKVAMVDIDEVILQRFKERASPLLCDYMNKREQPLRVEVFKGSVSKPNPYLVGFDAVIGIELIEHVYPDVLDEIPFHIFSYMNPKIVIFTTPNCEFNVLFPDLVNFRHDDHKFEWSRAEFQDWCNNICLRFPDYCVQFHGIGNPPECNKDDIGPCSQLGLFIRKDVLELMTKDDESLESQELILESTEPLKVPEDSPEHVDYHLIQSVDYPFFHDDRTKDEKLLDEAEYHLNRFRNFEEIYFVEERQRLEIPLTVIANCTYRITESLDELRSVLKQKYEIIDDNIILQPDEESNSEDEY